MTKMLTGTDLKISIAQLVEPIWRIVLASISFSHRICGCVCASLVAAIAAVQISPLIGLVSLLFLTAGMLLWKQIKIAFTRFSGWLTSTMKRGETWSGYENWPEVLLGHCLFAILGFAAWVIYLSFMEWAAKDITVAALVLVLSIVLPACLLRKEKTTTEAGKPDDQLEERRENFKQFAFRFFASGIISAVGVMFVTCPAFH